MKFFFIKILSIFLFILLITACNDAGKNEKQSKLEGSKDSLSADNKNNFLFLTEWFNKVGVYKYDLVKKKYSTVWWHPRENVVMLVYKPGGNSAYFLTSEKMGMKANFPFFPRARRWLRLRQDRASLDSRARPSHKMCGSCRFFGLKNRIIEHEFATPAAEGDSGEGRFTVMGAGGTVETNIARWIGQFSQPDGSATKEKAKIEKLRVSGVEVHLVDIAGDFKDQAGPFAPAVTRPGYRMLGAIIVTEKHGQHFVKLYGPQPTIAKQEKAFQELINGLKVQ